MLTIITHAIVLFLGAGGGWYLNGKYAAKVNQVIGSFVAPPGPPK